MGVIGQVLVRAVLISQIVILLYCGAYSLLLVTARIYVAGCNDAHTMDRKEKVSIIEGYNNIC